LNSLFVYFIGTTSGGYVDAAIFTADEDLEEDGATFERREFDFDLPLSGTRI
jgi:hypothetical protein